MTRKDYVAIAGIFERANRCYNRKHSAKQHAESIARDVADLMAADNPRFDRQRFLKACGF